MKILPALEKNSQVLQLERLMPNGYYSKALKVIENYQNIEDLDVLLLKSRIYELHGYFEHSLELAYLALGKSKEKESFRHELTSSVCIAYALWRLNKFDDALEIISKKEEIIHTLSVHYRQNLKTEEASLYNIKGLILWKTNQLDSALMYLQRGLSLREELHNEYDRSYSLNNIGNVYLKQNNLEKAYEYYLHSLEIRKKLRNKPAIAASYNSLARYYEQTNNYSQALYYHKNSLTLWKNVNNKQFIAKSLRFIGSNYQLQNNKKLALKYYQQSAKLFEEIGNTTDLELTTQLIGRLKTNN